MFTHCFPKWEPFDKKEEDANYVEISEEKSSDDLEESDISDKGDDEDGSDLKFSKAHLLEKVDL